MLHKRATTNAIIKQIMKNANGIGESKLNSKINSDIKGQNGQQVSYKAHSIKSTQNLRSVTTQYINFVDRQYKGKPLSNVNNKTMKEFVKSKIEEGLSLSSANTYISTLAKMSDNLNQIGVNATNREDITAYRSELKAEFGTLQTVHKDRAYKNTYTIIEKMKDTPYSLSVELQVHAGLRIEDSLNMEKIKVNEDNSLYIKGSKNGLNYSTKVLDKDLIAKVKTAVENGYRVNEENYVNTLKEAIESAGQKWNGSHGLRYSYAQREIANGRSKAEVSLFMGHSRENVTDTYLGV